MSNHSPFITILTAEDDPDDCELVRQAFLESGQKNSMQFVQDGTDLMQYLHRQGKYASPAQAPRPDLILLDLNMPRMDGRDSLAEIKADPQLRSIPVVVLTVSEAEEDILSTYNLGGAGFIIKPSTFQGWVDVVKCLSQYWFEVVELSDGGSRKTTPPVSTGTHPLHKSRVF
jgi:two-component system, response regulator